MTDTSPDAVARTVAHMRHCHGKDYSYAALIEAIASQLAAANARAENYNLFVEALSEIKATVDGQSDQSVKSIIDAVLFAIYENAAYQERHLALRDKAAPAVTAPITTVQDAARVLLGVFEDPYANAPHGFDWQSMYDEMTADHKESLDICGTHDWPSTLIVALRAIAGGGDE